jgi:hypothetical protein
MKIMMPATSPIEATLRPNDAWAETGPKTIFSSTLRPSLWPLRPTMKEEL